MRFIEEQILTSVSPPEITCGILVEPIESDAGVIVPPDDFLPGLRALCDLALVAPSDETAVIQQIYMTAAHAICSVVERDLGEPERA